MDRRDFMRTVGVAGGLATMASGIGGSMASAAHHEAAGSGTAARAAMRGLLDAIREVEDQLIRPGVGFSQEELAEAERSLAHILYTALDFWLEGDPGRPVFRKYVTPTRKLLGCNPDSIYYFAPIRDDKTYRITGNLGASTFTSFSTEPIRPSRMAW